MTRPPEMKMAYAIQAELAAVVEQAGETFSETELNRLRERKAALKAALSRELDLLHTGEPHYDA